MFDFVDGASGDEKLCENNSKALDQIRLQPKVLRNVEKRIIKERAGDFCDGIEPGVSLRCQIKKSFRP